MSAQKKAAALSSAMAILRDRHPTLQEYPVAVHRDMHRRNIKLIVAYMEDMPVGSMERERAEKTVACLEAQVWPQRTVVVMTPGASGNSWVEQELGRRYANAAEK